MKISHQKTLLVVWSKVTTFRLALLCLLLIDLWIQPPSGLTHGQYSGGPLHCGRQQASLNKVTTCPEPVRFERDMTPICLADMLPQWSSAFRWTPFTLFPQGQVFWSLGCLAVRTSVRNRYQCYVIESLSTAWCKNGPARATDDIIMGLTTAD